MRCVLSGIPISSSRDFARKHSDSVFHGDTTLTPTDIRTLVDHYSLNLAGRSEFEFQDGVIAKITDIS